MTEQPSQWVLPPEPSPGPLVRYANAAERALATLIDYVVVVLIGGIPYAIIGAGKPTAEPLLRNLGGILILVVYFAVFGWIASFRGGQTIGGRVLGIRIVRRDGGPIREWQAAVRPIGVLITAVFWFISLIAVVLGAQKRTPTDALTGTVVIKQPKAVSTQPPA
jgi:uncharacterized RDD family membrane protein YckC